nr:hypothetical protein CFP56_50463 [Quercus suber]POE49551.1 hypothetical protein CFP56_50468 [Quercus suber]
MSTCLFDSSCRKWRQTADDSTRNILISGGTKAQNSTLAQHVTMIVELSLRAMADRTGLRISTRAGWDQQRNSRVARHEAGSSAWDGRRGRTRIGRRSGYKPVAAGGDGHHSALSFDFFTSDLSTCMRRQTAQPWQLNNDSGNRTRSQALVASIAGCCYEDQQQPPPPLPQGRVSRIVTVPGHHTPAPTSGRNPALDFFRRSTLPALKKCWPSRLWYEPLEASINRHASTSKIAAAVGAQHRLLESQAWTTNVRETEQDSFECFGSALASWRRALWHQQDASIVQRGLGHILFMLLSILRGSPAEFTMHLRGSLMTTVRANELTADDESLKDLVRILRNLHLDSDVWQKLRAACL